MTDDAEKVTYKEAIVSFIDILGFKELISSTKKSVLMLSLLS